MSDQVIYNMILVIAISMMVFFTKQLYERSEEYSKLLKFERLYTKAILEPFSEYTKTKDGRENFIATMSDSTNDYIKGWEKGRLSYYFYLPAVFDAKTSFALNAHISKRKESLIVLFFKVILTIGLTVITIWMNKPNNAISVNYLGFIISCICCYVLILSTMRVFLKPKEKNAQVNELTLHQDLRLWLDRLYFVLMDILDDGLEEVRVIVGIKYIDRRDRS